jgi:peroxiredoxin
MFGGQKVATLAAGAKAPNFELPTLDGSRFSLQDALALGPVVAVFFKISCPVCQYAFPFFERIYKAHGGGKVTIVGISQNDAKSTTQFLQRFGVTFPILLDDLSTYPASNAYGLTNVPTTFWIGRDGEIEISSVGWSKADVEEIARKAAQENEAAPQALFQPTESIAEFRPG